MHQKLLKMPSKTFNLAQKYKNCQYFDYFGQSNLLLENRPNCLYSFFYYMKQVMISDQN